MLSISSIIEIAKVSQYLAQNDIDNKGLYGGGIDLDLPQKLFNIRKSVEWMYNQDSTEPTLAATSEYLLALCAKYRALAQLNLQPQIIPSTLKDFGEVNLGLHSEPQILTIRANSLPAPGHFEISVIQGEFEVSIDGITWSDQIIPTISYNESTVAPFNIYVRFSPNGLLPSGGYEQGLINILSFADAPFQPEGSAVVFLSGTGVIAELTAIPDTITFPTIAVLDETLDYFYLSGLHLENPPDTITLTSPSTNYQLSLYHTGFSSSITIPYTSSTLDRTIVYVKFIPQSTGTKSGNITIVGGGDSINVAVTGVGGTALLTANPTTISAFSSTPVGTVTASKYFDVTGVYLQGSPADVTITAPSTDFQVSNDNTTWGATATIPFTESTLSSTRVYVRFSPQSGGAKSGNVTVSGGGATTVNVAVSGAAAAASVSATALTNFGDLGITFPFTNSQNYSASQTIVVTGTGLSGTALTITGTANFQISLTGTIWTNGALNLPYTGSSISTTVYVQFVPLTVGAKSENITITGGGLASTVNIAAAGTGVVEFYISVVGATSIKMQYVQSATTKILWGDGTIDTNPGAVTVTKTHNYDIAYTGYIIIQMNAYTNITQLYINYPSPDTRVTSITINAFYFGKLTALTACILDSKVSLVRYAVGAPMATSSLPQSLVSLTLYKADVGGTVQGLPSGLTFLDIRDNNTINGTIDELFTRCASLTNVLIDGSNTISGDIADIPSGVTSIKIFGNNTITGTSLAIPTSVLKFRILGNNTIHGSLQDISHWSTILEFSIGGVLNASSSNTTSYITGTLNNITFSSSLKIFQVTYGINTITGQLSTTITDATHFQLPANIETFELRGESSLNPAFGNALIAAIGDFPTAAITTLNVGGLNTISGNLNTYSSSTIRTFVIDGVNTLSGLLQNAPANVQFFQITGKNTISQYTATKTWGASGVMNYFALYSTAVGYTGFTSGTQSQLNQLFVDLNVASWQDSGVIARAITYPRQGTVVPTGDGATALTTLTTVKGVTVTAKTY